ncbi:MAG: hypothetical protein M3N26_08290 [Pseudomonadota bacterium]|nr:hypothetical protein [Pseudomonadota bacterium]
MEESLDEVEAALARGDVAAAVATLVPILEERVGDRACALAVRVMTQGPFAPDAMAGTVDRLVALVREQENQIRALHAMVETAL